MTPSHQSSGRVVKIHLACRASIPIGSHLRVTGTHIWDPTETGNPDDPSNAASVASQIGQSAYDKGKLGLGGMVVNEDEVAQTGDGHGSSVLERQALQGGIHDDRSSWHATSIEMVTSPKTYPLWRTRRPVIVTLTDPRDGRDMEKVIHHQYRYLVATPGSEIEPHGLPTFESLQETDSFSMKKISSSGVELNAMTPGKDGIQFPVTLWENPPAFNDSFGARSVDSEITVPQGSEEKPYDILSNLCYRSLEIDTLNGNVIRPPGSHEFTEDGVLVDNWNRADDTSFQAYAEREKVRIDSLADLTASASNNPDTVTPIAATRRRLYFVCYHLPVSVTKNARGEWQVAWSESNLANTVDNNLVCDYTPHWVGTVRTDDHILDDQDRDELKKKLAAMDCTVIFFDSTVRKRHYKGFCKQVLWEVFHYVDLVDIQNNAFGFDLDIANDPEKSSGTIHDLRSLWDQVGQW